MNKNIVLVLALMGFGTMPIHSMQLSVQEEQTRLDSIRNLSRQGALSPVQYVVGGRIDGDLLQRDIDLFEKDSASVLSKKSWASGYLSRLWPSILGIWGATNSLSAIGSLTLAGSGSNQARMLWDSYETSSAIDSRPYSTLVYDFFKNVFDNPHALEKAKFENQDEALKAGLITYTKSPKVGYMLGKGNVILPNPLQVDEKTAKINTDIMALGMASPGIALGGVVAGLLGWYFWSKSSQIRKNNAIASQKLQDQYNNNLAIIAQLRQIQYDVSRGR